MFKYIFLALFVTFLDQLSKYIILTYVDFGEVINIIPFLNITLTHNYGAAFGLLANESGWQIWAFLSIAIFVSLAILIWLKFSIKQNKSLESFSLMLVLGGAIGNVIDRFFRGFVVDFIDFYIQDWHWYTFNISDTAICIGAALLIVDIFILRHKPKVK